MEKFLIIDGNSIANRAFYALPFLTNREAKPSGAVFGFANIIVKLLLEEKPDYIAVAFDHARKTFRNQIYSEYKMQRKPTPTELVCQFEPIKEMLRKMQIQVIEQEGIEADDIIGTLSKKFNTKNILLSGDRDLLQLIDNNTNVWLTKKGVSELDKVDEKRLDELFALKPYQIIELKGLMGDASDNIPGVAGVGEKTAQNLLNQYLTIEKIYENLDEIKGKLKEKLENGREMAFMSKTLATIKRDCDLNVKLEDCKLNFPFDSDVYEFFNEWNFSSLVKNNKLFDVKKTEAVKSTKTILDEAVLDKMAAKKMEVFCYDLKELNFLFENKVYGVEKNFSMFEDVLTIEQICKKLKAVFEDKKILKITKEAKRDMHILYENNIVLNNYFDLSVAQYMLNSGNKNSLDGIGVEKYEETKNQLLKAVHEKGLEYVYNDIEEPLTEILFEMENNGFKIDREKLQILDKEFDEKIQTYKKEIYFDAGEEFNINSPKQVAYILFDKLGIKAYNNKKQSTSANVLEELRYIPIVDKILQYRKFMKIKTTYIDVYNALIAESGDIIHTTFNQTLTSTGRLSSSEPNLQNIPTRDDIGKNLRKIFVSKFKNGKIISADYNQIELRLLADMSGEEKLIAAYNNGGDIHRATAAEIFGIDKEKVTDAERREAKAINFGIIYGISDFGLSQNIKISRAKAKAYIDSYFTRYPSVKTFMNNNVEFAKQHGYSVTKFGRIRNIPEINSSKYNIRQFGERVAMNMPLQGTASDIIKLAMIRVHNAFVEQNIKSQLILQIHDELIVDTCEDEIEKVKTILRREMENVVTLRVPLIVSMGIGDNLYDCK